MTSIIIFNNTVHLAVMVCDMYLFAVLINALLLNAIFQNQRLTSTNCIHKTASRFYSQ